MMLFNKERLAYKQNNNYKKDSDRLFVKRLAIKKNKTDDDFFIDFHRAYILPTRKGLYYFFTIVIMFVWSVNYALSLGYALTFFAVVFALLSAGLVINNITSISFSSVTQEEFFAGEAAYFCLSVNNKKSIPTVCLTARRNGLTSKPISISPKKDRVIEVPLDETSRGKKKLDYFRLSASYPVGIFYSWIWLYMDISLIIYPKPKGNLPLPLLSDKNSIDEGVINCRGTEDFYDLREYRAGDNIKHILWRKISYGYTRVKVFNDSIGLECILDFDSKLLINLDKEEKISQLCQWVLSAEKQGIKYALFLPNNRSIFSIGEKHKRRCLEALACY